MLPVTATITAEPIINDDDTSSSESQVFYHLLPPRLDQNREDSTTLSYGNSAQDIEEGNSRSYYTLPSLNTEQIPSNESPKRKRVFVSLGWAPGGSVNSKPKYFRNTNNFLENPMAPNFKNRNRQTLAAESDIGPVALPLQGEPEATLGSESSRAMQNSGKEFNSAFPQEDFEYQNDAAPDESTLKLRNPNQWNEKSSIMTSRSVPPKTLEAREIQTLLPKLLAYMIAERGMSMMNGKHRTSASMSSPREVLQGDKVSQLKERLKKYNTEKRLMYVLEAMKRQGILNNLKSKVSQKIKHKFVQLKGRPTLYRKHSGKE